MSNERDDMLRGISDQPLEPDENREVRVVIRHRGEIVELVEKRRFEVQRRAEADAVWRRRMAIVARVSANLGAILAAVAVDEAFGLGILDWLTSWWRE